MNFLGALFGTFLSSIGLMFILLYTNLLTMGYSFWNFVKFISKRFECLLFLFGIIILLLSLERSIKNVLLLRRSSKFRDGWRHL